VVTLWGRQRSREEPLARVGRLEQMAGMLVDGEDGPNGACDCCVARQERPSTSRSCGPGRCEHPRRYRMASGSGARIVHAIDLEPTYVYR